MTTTEPIDIYNHGEGLQHDLETLAGDTRLSTTNRRLIGDYVRAARAGRITPQSGGRRRLTPARCRKILTTLKRFALFVQAPLDELTPEQMERFILGIEDGTVRKLIPVRGSDRYTPASCRTFKLIIRGFLRHTHPGQSERLEQLCGWFDMRDVNPEVSVFGLEEARRMATRASSMEATAFIWLLFDSGARIGEALNIRLSDLEFRPVEGRGAVCFVRIRISKTRPRTISLPYASEAIRFWVERHPKGGPVGADGHINAAEPSAPLIAWSYSACLSLVRKLGTLELGRRIHPHQFRAASATHFARYLTSYELAARYGWTMGSRSIQRYLDRSGLMAEDIAKRMLGEKKKEESVLSGTARDGDRAAPARAAGAWSAARAHREGLPGGR